MSQRRVQCGSCEWIGTAVELLHEIIGAHLRLYCPVCTSTKWFYTIKETSDETHSSKTHATITQRADTE